MTNEPTMDFSGFGNGLTAILEPFQNMIDDIFSPDVIPMLLGILGGLLVVFGVWYGLRAILRSVRVVK